MSDRSDSVDSVVVCVLSRILGEYRPSQCGDLYVVQRALRLYAPDLPTRSRTAGPRRALADLGLTRRGLNLQWQELKHAHHADARFDRTLIDRVFEPRLQRALMKLVADRPRQAARNMESALFAYSRQEVRPTRARPQGGTMA